MELIGGILFFTMAIACSSLKFVIEHERLVVFRMGRAVGVKGPGPVFLMPIADRFMKVDLRETSVDIPLELLTSDNIRTELQATCVIQVEDPYAVCTRVEQPYEALSKIVDSVLRDKFASSQSSALVSLTEQLRNSAVISVNEQTSKWGLKVKDVQLHSITFGASALSSSGVAKSFLEFQPDSKAPSKVPTETVAANNSLSASIQRAVAAQSQEKLITALAAASTRREDHSLNNNESKSSPSSTVAAAASLMFSNVSAAGTVPSDANSSNGSGASSVEPSFDVNRIANNETNVPGGEQISKQVQAPSSSENESTNNPLESLETGKFSKVPVFAMPIISATGFEGLEEILGNAPEALARNREEVMESAPDTVSGAPITISPDLTAAVTGHSRATCRKCEMQLEGLLCFGCWELN